jgi:putative peptidoglycan lipid II flippase
MQYTGTQYAAPGYQGKQRGPNRGLMVTVILVVVIVIAALVWVVGFRKPGSSGSSGTGAQPSTSASAAPGGTVLKPTGVVTFNPYGKPPGNTENPASLKVGGSSVAWSTSYYFDRPNFGGLKPGTGLLINLGKQVRISQVEAMFSSNGGPTTAAIYLGNNPTDSAATALSNFTLVSPAVSVSGDHKFSVSSQTTGQYVLIWLTSLPKLLNTPAGASGGTSYYEAQLANITVTGSTASGNS